MRSINCEGENLNSKIEIVKNMGLSWTLYRAKYELEKKTGLLKKRYSSFSYDDIHISSIMLTEIPLKELVKTRLATSFFQVNSSHFNDSKEIFKLEEAIKTANDILEKKFIYFSKHPINFEKIDWHYSPFTKKKSPERLHWTEIGDLSSDFGDIKWIWELSRFSFVYPLCRAFEATKDEKYVKEFWNLFEDFIENNPAELGVNYKCGQEISLRIMAWMFGLNTFIDSPETTEKRLELMLKAIHHHADHVEKHFDFALKSVKNNHSLSEAAGMYTVGTVFPFFNFSSKWKAKGKKYIQSEADWQIYNDGSYIQHSFNYQRLAIQDLTWVLRLSQIDGVKLSKKFISKFKKTVEFMYQMQTHSTGRVPNYGMNDGAYIHPLTSSEYLDHRPALQAAWLTLTDKRLYAEKEVDEIALWLGLDSEKAVDAPIKESKIFPEGGYAVLRNELQFVMTRCTSYKHRPVQADMLHLDFWDQEYNILADAGTFSYNTAQDELLYFNGTASHNTVMINQQDQMKKASRFIWLNWTKAKIIKFKITKDFSFFEGEHYGYSPIVHKRAIMQAKDTLVVVDDLLGDIQRDSIALSWLFGVHDVRRISNMKWVITLPNGENWTMCLITKEDIEVNLFTGSKEPVAGWRSLYYGNKEAFPQLIVNTTITEKTRLITVLKKNNPSPVISLSDKILKVDKLKIDILPIGSETIFNYMEL